MKLSAPLSKSQFGIYVECASHQNEPFYNLPYYYDIIRLLCLVFQTLKKNDI